MNQISEITEFWGGQLLEIHTLDREVFFSQIMEVDTNLLIQRPVNKKNIPLLITNHMPVTVYFNDDQQGLCTFQSNILLHQNRFAIIIKPSTDSIEKAQRRRFFRVQAGAELGLSLKSSESANKDEQTHLITHDISGGGLSFLCSNKVVEVGGFVAGSLHLKTNTYQKKVEFHGKIVNTIKTENQLFKISLQFIEMKESVRTDIVKYCMCKQIEWRNKLKSDAI